MEENDNVYLESLKRRNYELYKYFQRGLEIISILKSKMFEAYIVGGAVRDFILDIDFKDIDIATSATPSDVIELFKNCNIDDTYASLGCVVIREYGFNYEITTFRNEEYVKCKIKDVHYSKKFAEDAIRRDYTINALALTPNLTIIDQVDGRNDLQKGIVRIIGKGKQRFREDPSRILRGLKLVSKYNYKIESNTLRAMRKSRVLLKEISDVKFVTEMEAILSEKNSLQALRVIDDNNLFKFLPTYAYWVKLMIKKHKQLTLVEKYCLLYRITGEMPKNIEARKEMAMEVKKIADASLNISVNQVDSMMVFKFGADLLLSADRVSKAYNPKYRKQKRNIKKIDRHLKIRSINELYFSARELVLMMRDDQKHLTNQIMSELVYKVLNGEIDNTCESLRSEAKRLLNPKVEEPVVEKPKDDNRSIPFVKKDEGVVYPDIEQETSDDFNEYEKTIECFDGWDMIPVDESYYGQMSTENESPVDEQTPSFDEISEARLQSLKKEFDEDYYSIYKVYLRGIDGLYFMDEEERKVKEDGLKQQAKEFLLKSNPKYIILQERGMI